MEVSRFDDAAAFLRHAGRLLQGHAIDNNVMLGIAGRLIDEPQADAVMLAVDEAGAPRIVALMTPPWRLVVSTGSAGAIGALVDGVLEAGPRPPGVVGPADMAEGFAAAWREATGETATLADEMVLYTTGQAVAPDAVPGLLRAAADADTGWVIDAFIGFAETVEASPGERAASRETATGFLRRGQVFLWRVDGAPVSMACSHRMAPDGARVGPVFTPPAERGRGYASAAVAALTTCLLGDGAAWCAIFSDADNATTNAIYRRIGYNRHGTYREYDFAS